MKVSDKTDWQAFSIELAQNAKRNLDAKDDEITTLRQQLADAKEENERVRQANIHTMDVFEDMKAAKEKAEALVAELAAKAHNLSFGIVNSLTDEQQEPFAKQFAELQDCIAALSSEPYVLRKQAEAVEAFAKDEGMSWPTTLARGLAAAAKQYAQRLRQQADDAERAGGEQ